MFKNAEERELAERLAITEAKMISERELNQLSAISRVVMFLACYNANKQLHYTTNNAIVLPRELLAQMCLGFAQDSLGRAVFCVFFQDYLWREFKHIPLQLVIMEKEERSVLLRFGELPVGDFKIPHLDISIPIVSNAMWNQLQNRSLVRFATIGKVEEYMDSGKYRCSEIQSNPCGILDGFKMAA